jgi:hypothetical protein
VLKDIGLNATSRVVREDVCTYIRALGKYQHITLHSAFNCALYNACLTAVKQTP